jgi:Ca2+-binding RTX toxin-like protein
MSGSTTGIGVWTNGAGARDAAVTPVDGSPTSGNDHFWGDALVVADAAGTGIVLGAPSDNFAEGGLGNDTLEGNQGSDTLVGGNGIDSLLGGAGDDTLIAFSATGTFSDGLVDTVAGGAGNDTYYVPASDIVDESASMGGAGVDTVVTDAARYSLLAVDGYVFGGVENLIGVRQFGQQLIGNELGNSITGGAADDTITGGAGGDTLDGGGGTNTLNYLGGRQR